MEGYSTREAAKKLNISLTSMNRYIADGKIPVPAVQDFGGGKLRIWMAEDIERVRDILPKIANGRRTRYKKERSAIRKQQSVKTKTGPKRSTRKKH